MIYDSELLESTKNEILKLLNVITDIQSGQNEDYACKKNDIRPQKFRCLLATCQEKRNIVINKEPEEKLYEALFETTNYAAYPSDLNKTIPFVMNKYLDEQERDILDRLYWKNETYEAIRISYNTNASIIKKITRQALNKLRNEEAIKYIEFGLNYEEDLKKIRENNTNESRSDFINHMVNNIPREITLANIQASYLSKTKLLVNELSEDLDYIYNQKIEGLSENDIEVTIQTCNSTPSTGISVMPNKIKNIKIRDMNLPTRLINSLHKIDVFTIGDLMMHSRLELKNTRGIGITMIETLETQLATLNIKLI